MTKPAEAIARRPETLGEHYRRVRATTVDLIRDLQPEDTVVQTMPDVSPTKWQIGRASCRERV